MLAKRDLQTAEGEQQIRKGSTNAKIQRCLIILLSGCLWEVLVGHNLMSLGVGLAIAIFYLKFTD